MECVEESFPNNRYEISVFHNDVFLGYYEWDDADFYLQELYVDEEIKLYCSGFGYFYSRNNEEYQAWDYKHGDVIPEFLLQAVRHSITQRRLHLDEF